MLPELIYREEREKEYPLLVVLGLLSGLAGFAAAKILFPSQLDILAVIFAAIPLAYPLTRLFLEDEKDGKPHIPEIKSYASVFVGEMAAFFAIGMMYPDLFKAQLELVNIAGYATSSASFAGIFSHNLIVFISILALSALVGTAGVFILTWNASVLGIFFAVLVRSLENASGLLTCKPSPSPICYVPHATFEMAAFIIAGISGTLISAAVYREHFDKETWKDYGKLLALGLVTLLLGAVLETA